MGDSDRKLQHSPVCQSVDNDFLIDHMPWLLGSIGTMVFDITIFIQFMSYGTEGRPTVLTAWHSLW